MELKKLNNFKEVLEKSKEKTQVILKFSNACGYSLGRLALLREFLEGKNTENHLVTVQEQRPLSAEIEETLKVKHETPQVLVIKNGDTIVLNHSKINKENLNLALKN